MIIEFWMSTITFGNYMVIDQVQMKLNLYFSNCFMDSQLIFELHKM